MQMKVIDYDKVKVLVEPKDYCNIKNIENITDYTQKSTREFVLKLMQEIYLQTGINFLSSKVLLETVSGGASSFYIIITRLENESTPDNPIPLKADEDMYLFELYGVENIFNLIKLIKNSKQLKTGENRLFKYKDKYYLAVNFSAETVSMSEFEKFIVKSGEYCKRCKWSLLSEAFLKEWGEEVLNSPIKKL